jgi:hypothetical protein
VLRFCALLVALPLWGCTSSDPRFAERPLSPDAATGVAIVHDARISSIVVEDPSHDVVDHYLDRHFAEREVPAARRTHFAGRRVFWSSRPRGTTVASVFTLPPGAYRLIAFSEAPVVDDALGGVATMHRLEGPLWLRIPWSGVLAGELRCVADACTFDTSPLARGQVRDLLAWELTQPHAERDVALWRSWLPAIDDANGGPQ